jgi:hypothetical protein
VIDRTFDHSDIAEAHRYVDTGRKKGNVVVLVCNAPSPVALSTRFRTT